MYCNRCDAPLPEGIVICPECGARQRRQARSVRCAYCHQRASVELVMCPHCGRDLRPAGPRWGLWLTTAVVVILAGLWGLGRLPIRQIWQEINDTRARLAELVQIPELPTPVPTPAATRGLAQVQMSPTATLVLPVASARPSLQVTAAPTGTVSLAGTTIPPPTLAVTATLSASASATASPPGTAFPPGTASPTGTGTVTLTTPITTPAAGESYTVQSGDTLAGIGARLGLDWQLIAQLNGISASTILRVGQKLKLPTPTPRPVTPTASAAAITSTGTPAAAATAAPVAATAAPSATPTAASQATPGRPAATATATKVPGPTATSRPRPTATPTLPAATPTPGFPAPVLINPADGTPFSGDDAYFLLEWKAVEGLPAGALYQVTVNYTHNGAPYTYYWRTSRTDTMLPRHLYGEADQPARRYTWFVTVVQVTTDGMGGERVIELSPPSETRSLSWS